MERKILEFARDEAGDWLARLACGHSQHTRHNPPLAERPWVLTAEGREAQVGTPLDCVLCDEASMPETHAAYQQTKAFTEETVPSGLLADHTTKPGVWALIHVEQGQLDYVRHAPFDDRRTLTPEAPGVVLPDVVHHVVCDGPVRFHVEFWRARPRAG